MKTIEITINHKGEATVQTKGFTGASCRDASRLIERALGTVQSDTATAEMHHTANTERHLRQGGG